MTRGDERPRDILQGPLHTNIPLSPWVRVRWRVTVVINVVVIINVAVVADVVVGVALTPVNVVVAVSVAPLKGGEVGRGASSCSSIM